MSLSPFHGIQVPWSAVHVGRYVLGLHEVLDESEEFVNLFP